jgi:hypothetical protein
MNNLVYLDEPNMLFAHEQKCTDPRDGLSLFGPLSHRNSIKYGVVSTIIGLNRLKQYIEKINGPVFNLNNTTRPMFPGFEAVFNCKLETSNFIFKEIETNEINQLIYNSSNNVRTYDLVSLYINKIITSQKNDDENVDLWFVVVPEEVYKYCRPKSVLESNLVKFRNKLSTKLAKEFVYEPNLFDEFDKEDVEYGKEAMKYKYEAQFHNQLKARLLLYNIPTQIIRESTIAWNEFQNSFGMPIRNFSKIEGHLAWTMSTAIFYKAVGKPWKLSDIRKGVCYLGIVYKMINEKKTQINACCAAQMFLDSGDGTVFKGAVGPWYNPKKGEFHLKRDAAKNLLKQAIDSYKELEGNYPKEVFIHAQTLFNDEEWCGFKEAKPCETNLVGVTIRTTKELKLFKQFGDYPILRGLAYIVNDTNAYLWTLGYVSRTQTSLSMEVPNPLKIKISKGTSDIKQVLKDILALTKLNYNACIYGDGVPVTLRFANNIGEILTAGKNIEVPPLAFKYYI